MFGYKLHSINQKIMLSSNITNLKEDSFQKLHSPIKSRYPQIYRSQSKTDLPINQNLFFQNIFFRNLFPIKWGCPQLYISQSKRFYQSSETPPWGNIPLQNLFPSRIFYLSGLFNQIGLSSNIHIFGNFHFKKSFLD